MLSYLKGAAAAFMLSALMACSQNGTPETVTLQQVQDTIAKTCNYVPTINSIAQVGATIATAIDPAAGATATVLATTGNAIATTICNAVKAQQEKMSGKPTAAGDYVVTVNGVEVHGKLTEGKT